MKILNDEAREQVFGVRIKDREVRFVEREQGIDHFRNAVLGAVDSWSSGCWEELDQIGDRDPYGLTTNPDLSD